MFRRILTVCFAAALLSASTILPTAAIASSVGGNTDSRTKIAGGVAGATATTPMPQETTNQEPTDAERLAAKHHDVVNTPLQYQSVSPQSVDGIAVDGRFRKIVARNDTSCGITTRGQVACWDVPAPGSDTPESIDATVVPGIRGWVRSLAVNHESGCAITTRGQVYCWGNNDKGQADPSNPGDVVTTAKRVANVPRDVRHIALAKSYACAAGSTVTCWGSRVVFGDTDSTGAAPQTVDLPDTSGVTSVTAASNYACASFRSGDGYCWGYHQAVEITDENRPPHPKMPVDIDPTVPVKLHESFGSIRSVHAAQQYACALNRKGQVWCWGWGYSGQLGENAKGRHNYPPVHVTEFNSPIRSLSLDYSAVCGVTRSGAGQCMGGAVPGRMYDPVVRSYRGWGRGVRDVAVTWGALCKMTHCGKVACHNSKESALEPDTD